MFASSWASATGSPTVRTLLGDLARFAAATRMGSCVIVVVSWRGQPDHQATFRHHSPTPSPPIRSTSFQSLKPAGGNSLSMSRPRSEEHTTELQSLMRISYAVFCLKKKNSHALYDTIYTYTYVD